MKTLSARDLCLALAIMAVWGTNFVIIRIALDVMPPLLLAALRFTFALVPMALFLPRPQKIGEDGSSLGKVPWRNLAGYGVFIGLGQFGLLFIAMNGHISPGLASLVVQMQAFFTIGFSILRNAERVNRRQLAAFALAIAGMGVIMLHSGHGATVWGLALTLAAAASWAMGNQIAKEGRPANFLAYVVWASLFSLIPLYALSFLLEGPAAILHGLRQAGLATWAAVLWQSIGNTMFGYGCWAWLLARYPAATIAPTSLLVPVFGMAASALWLGEPIEGWKIAAALLVLAGLAVNLLWRTRPATASL